VVPLAAFAPTVLLIVLFLGREGTGVGGYFPDDFLWYRLRSMTELVSFDTAEYLLGTIFFRLLLLFSGALLIAKLVTRQWQRQDALLAVCSVLLVMYFTVPEFMSGGAFVTHRVALYVFLGFILWLGAQRYPPLVTAGVQAFAVVVSLAFLAVHVRKYVELDGQLREYMSAAEHIEPNSTVLPLSFAARGVDAAGRWRSRSKCLRTRPGISRLACRS
jgi:hypothetical protein